mmetsp:Transcript_11598/g.40356  ORF Transcript_11598/g.40356 Transcript_11598/m.40356 type:complete len:89 (+) Transcript_11598:2031-2297(+)
MCHSVQYFLAFGLTRTCGPCWGPYMKAYKLFERCNTSLFKFSIHLSHGSLIDSLIKSRQKSLRKVLLGMEIFIIHHRTEIATMFAAHR